MPEDTKLLIVVGSTDAVVGRHFGRRLMRQTRVNPRFKNLVTHRLDSHNLFAPINAGHDEPLSLTRISILTLVRRQYTPTLPEYHVFPR